MTAIEVKNLTVTANGVKLLDNVSFSVKKGEFITILGSNGAGKTTVLKSIMGFIKAAHGGIYIEGEKVKQSNAHAVRKKISYMPQSFEVDRFFPVSCGDILHMAAGAGAGIKTIAKEFEIEKLLGAPFGLVSGGEKQKVMLAMVLSRNPEILLLDEPGLHLDPKSHAGFMKLVDSIYTKRKLTILFVTHLINHTPVSSGKTVVLKNGELLFFGCKKELLKKNDLLEFVYD